MENGYGTGASLPRDLHQSRLRALCRELWSEGVSHPASRGAVADLATSAGRRRALDHRLPGGLFGEYPTKRQTWQTDRIDLKRHCKEHFQLHSHMDNPLGGTYADTELRIFLLQSRQPRVVLLKLGFSPGEQFSDALLRPDHYSIIIGNDQVAVSDDRASNRDRAAYERRSIFMRSRRGHSPAPYCKPRLADFPRVAHQAICDQPGDSRVLHFERHQAPNGRGARCVPPRDHQHSTWRWRR